MKAVKPPAFKSECVKKEVERPPPPRKKDRRPPWDNSLYTPKRKSKMKPTAKELAIIEEPKNAKAKESNADLGCLGGFGGFGALALPRDCKTVKGSCKNTDRQYVKDGVFGGLRGPCQPQDCKDLVCFTFKKGCHYPVVYGQHPCVHPRYPTCTPPICFPVQCYRKGPEKPMQICLSAPYEPPRRKFFCHKITSCDNNIPPGYPPNEYEFTYRN